MSEHKPTGPDRALVFGAVAEAYERGRPGYGRDAAAWLTGQTEQTGQTGQSGQSHGDRPLSVLELGAGTGKLTEQLVALGHDVHATDPDAAMLEVLATKFPRVRTSVASAEQLPAPDASYDVIVAAQCFHWFDVPRALDEASRVLRPGGLFSAVWNQRDERVPWVRRLGRIIGAQDQRPDPAAGLATSELFDDMEEADFGLWQVVDRRTIADLMLSRSNFALLDESQRQPRLEELLALYDEYGRGMDGMQVPYRTRCFRARVRPRPAASAPEQTLDAAPFEATDGVTDHDDAGNAPRHRLGDSAADLPKVAFTDPDDDALLLINLS